MDRELMRRWVLQWQETGRLLDEIRRRELRDMTPARRLQMISDVLTFPLLRPTPEARRRMSGLVAQQDLFQKFLR